jgi:uncharacterized protein YebE (UPF0316 family)
MPDWPFLSTWWFAYLVLPVLIFSARIVDVSLDTMRVIYIARGVRLLAAIAGFVQVAIWLLAISAAMKYLHNPVCFLAYAGGFATGTYVGIAIEGRLSIGRVILRVITQSDDATLVQALREAGFGVTCLDAAGASGPVKIIFTVIDRRDLGRAVALIDRFNPKAFYTVEDVRSVHEGVFHGPAAGRIGLWSRLRSGRVGE